MRSKTNQQILSASTAVLVILGIPVALRQLWVWFGPPYVNLASDPRNEFQTLIDADSQDYQGEVRLRAYLVNMGVSRNAAVLALCKYFSRCNKPRFAEAFVELAAHHLTDDSALAKESLFQAMRLDHGWHGQRAVGLFIASFANDSDAAMLCQILPTFPPDFAVRQLKSIRTKSQDLGVRASSLIELGKIALQDGNAAEAKEDFEIAMECMVKVEPGQLKAQRLFLETVLGKPAEKEQGLVSPPDSAGTIRNTGAQNQSNSIDSQVQQGKLNPK